MIKILYSKFIQKSGKMRYSRHEKTTPIFSKPMANWILKTSKILMNLTFLASFQICIKVVLLMFLDVKIDFVWMILYTSFNLNDMHKLNPQYIYFWFLLPWTTDIHNWYQRERKYEKNTVSKMLFRKRKYLTITRSLMDPKLLHC